MTIDTRKLREFAEIVSFDSDDVNSLLDHIDAQAAEIEALRQQWQPIETAPSGVMLLLADMNAREARHWAYVDWLVGGKCCGNQYRTPTHWTHLPAPPAALSGEGK